jgi:hypothetical protein
MWLFPRRNGERHGALRRYRPGSLGLQISQSPWLVRFPGYDINKIERRGGFFPPDKSSTSAAALFAFKGALFKSERYPV